MDGQVDLWKNSPPASQISTNLEKISAQLLIDSVINTIFQEQNNLENQPVDSNQPSSGLGHFPSNKPLAPDQLTPFHTGASADKPFPPGIYRLLDQLRQAPPNLETRLISPHRTSPIKGSSS